MIDQRMPSTQNGRRAFDTWGRAGKILAVIVSALVIASVVGKTYIASAQVVTNQSDIRALDSRVKILEDLKNDDHYMTCYMFQRVNPEGVPASCNLAIRQQSNPK